MRPVDRIGFSLLCCLWLGFCSAFAEDAKESAEAKPADEAKDLLAGHSAHGESFNEGPRQSAYLMDGIGRVRFPVTTKDPLAQRFVTQGVAQLHGFWYFEAERSFRQAAAIDPECAMAYWGMAMANRSNENRAKGFLEEAVKLKGKMTRREQLYIDSLDAYFKAAVDKKKERAEKYTQALEKLLYEFPDDIEAKAFLALQIWDNKSNSIPIASHLAVDALIQQVFAVEPQHPAHHYRIHLWDYERAETAVSSAAQCGQSLPAIAHMWHMPGHIFSRLKRYDDACWQQEASARVDHAHMMRDRVLPDQIHNFAHNNEWLIRNLNFVGRTQDAIDLAKNMIELPRHPKYNTLAKRGSSGFGRERLFETLSLFERWDEMIGLSAKRPTWKRLTTRRSKACGCVTSAKPISARAMPKTEPSNWQSYKNVIRKPSRNATRQPPMPKNRRHKRHTIKQRLTKRLPPPRRKRKTTAEMTKRSPKPSPKPRPQLAKLKSKTSRRTSTRRVPMRKNRSRRRSRSWSPPSLNLRACKRSPQEMPRRPYPCSRGHAASTRCMCNTFGCLPRKRKRR